MPRSPFLTLASKLVPRDTFRLRWLRRLLARNGQNVSKAVVVKPGHCVEVGGEGVALACSQAGQ
jgi:hypothetical protein